MDIETVELFARSIVNGFPNSELKIDDTSNGRVCSISFDGKLLVEVDQKMARFHFPTRRKSELTWSSIKEGGPKEVGDHILRLLADADYEVFSNTRRRIKKTPIHIGQFTVCPKCNTSGTIKEILYGLPAANYDSKRYLLGGCCVGPDGKDPEIECGECGWNGALEEVRFTRKRSS